MRYCLVSYEYPPETAKGGIGTQTWNKAKALTKRGHQVEVLSCVAQAGSQATRSVEEGGIVVHRMQRPGEAGRQVPLYDPSSFMLGYTWSVLESLTELQSRTGDFDLVNFPEYGAEGFAFQANRTIYNWIPTIVQLHAPTAMLAERMGWPPKESLHYRTASFFEGESIRMADGWMASSANIADFVAQFYQIPRERIDVVHCGVDCEMFRPKQATAAQPERPTILFIGDLSISKGVETVFRAVMQLRDRFPNIRCRFVGKENHLVRKLRREAEDQGLAESFEWIPYVKERHDIIHLYQQADLFASPADHENGVANVYVEAMACGCPVIAANTGGAPEAVVDGETGILVPPRDVKAVGAAMERLLSDRIARNRMAAAGRQRAVEYFAQEQYILRVLAAYDKAIATSRNKLQKLKSEIA